MEIAKVDITNEIEEILKPVLSTEYDEVIQDIKEGISELYVINNNSYLITRIDNKINKELVIVCYVGKGIRELSKIMHTQAKQLGIKTVRFHTKRPGLERLMNDYDWTCDELIYRYTTRIT